MLCLPHCRTIAVELLLAAWELARKKVSKTGIVSYSLQEPTDDAFCCSKEWNFKRKLMVKDLCWQHVHSERMRQSLPVYPTTTIAMGRTVQYMKNAVRTSGWRKEGRTEAELNGRKLFLIKEVIVWGAWIGIDRISRSFDIFMYIIIKFKSP